MLEPESDFLWAGAEETYELGNLDDIDIRTVVDFASYAEEVRLARDEIVAQLGSADKPVYEGKLLDIAAVGQKLYDRLTSESGGGSDSRTYRDRWLFEAATGVDCSHFYDEQGVLQRLPAAATMEAFLESDEIRRFKPGQRVFFGHPIPK